MSTQGKRLKKIRNALHLTQEQFGAVLGISKQFYSNIETDRCVLNNEKLVLLYKDYNVNINFLLGGAGNLFNDKNEIDDDFSQKVRIVLKNEGLIK